MVIDLDKFAETIIKAVSDAKVFGSPQHQHKDYIIKKNLIKYVVYDDDEIETEDKSVKNNSIVFFRNSDDIEKCIACLISWNFDDLTNTRFFVKIQNGFIDKSDPENFHVNDFAESIYVTWFQSIVNTIIEAIL